MKQTDFVQTTHVRYKGRLVEVSLNEYKILALRGHILPNYGHAPIVLPEICLELRDEKTQTEAYCCSCTKVVVEKTGDFCPACARKYLRAKKRRDDKRRISR